MLEYFGFIFIELLFVIVFISKNNTVILRQFLYQHGWLFFCREHFTLLSFLEQIFAFLCLVIITFRGQIDLCIGSKQSGSKVEANLLTWWWRLRWRGRPLCRQSSTASNKIIAFHFPVPVFLFTLPKQQWTVKTLLTCD